MATIVEEIMNRELFALTPEETPERALRYLFQLGVGGAPVLDSEGRPAGMLSLRDLARPGPTAETIAERMNSPVATVAASSPIEDAGRLLAETGFHRLVAVDEAGRAVGLVSSLDVIRGLMGLPASHPSTFPHYDTKTGLVWTDDAQLAFERVELAPEAPGVFVLIHGGPSMPETVVWAEAAPNVRRRLVEILVSPRSLPRRLHTPISRGLIRFRAAAAYDSDQRERALQAISSPSAHS